MIEYQDDDNLIIELALPQKYIERQCQKVQQDMKSIRRAMEMALAKEKTTASLELFDTNFFRTDVIADALERMGVRCTIQRKDSWARFEIDMSDSEICQSILNAIELLIEEESDEEEM